LGGSSRQIAGAERWSDRLITASGATLYCKRHSTPSIDSTMRSAIDTSAVSAPAATSASSAAT
jgi:hypothetical protein